MGSVPVSAMRAERVVAEADVDRAGRMAAALHQRGDMVGGVLGRLGGLQFDGDRRRDERLRARARRDWRVARQAIAIGADRAGEDERQPGRAVLQFVQRLGIGHGRIGMIDPRMHRPGAAARRRSVCASAARAIERLDRNAVVGFGDQPLERPFLQRRADELQPVLAAGGRKFGGERRFVRHRPKCHGPGGRANPAVTPFEQ